MKTHSLRHCIAAAVVLGIGAGATYAADNVELSLDKLPFNVSGQTSLQGAATDRAALNGLSALLGPQETFAMQPERKTGTGEQLERGQQTFKGIKVHGAELVATRDKLGQYTFVNGNVLQNIDRDLLSVTPRLSAQIVERQAQATYRAHGTIYDSKAPQLLVYQRNDGRAVLAWRVEFAVRRAPGQLPLQPVRFIDAQTGQLISEYNNLQHVEERGRGPGGNQRMGQIEHGNSEGGVDGFLTVDKTGTTCRLANSKTRVMDAMSSTNTSSTTAKAFTCSDSNNRNVEPVTNGAYGVLNDILYNGTRTVDMYRDWFGVYPLTCANILNQYGHYDRSLDNAYWQNCKMHYGDGSSFHPLVSMDVVSHEIGHGVTEGRSGLVYSGQSGGLNESFSDMAGMALVYYLTGNNDWKIGSQIRKGSGQLRCMDNPPCDGRSIKHVSNYTSGMDVHYSSGVYNYAFYRLSTRSGWNTKKAFEVYYKANDLYWTSTTNFAQAGEGACRAAKDLGYNGDDVKATLQEIGVNPTQCASGPGDSDTPIQNGVPVNNINVAAGEQKFYKLDVPAGATGLRFSTSGGSGDADLYVKFGSRPTTSDNICKSESSTTTETCNIPSAQAGTYYVLLYGYAAANGVSITASYTTDGGGGGEVVLQNGVPVSGINLAQNEQKFYKLEVPAGSTSVRFVTTGGSGDVDVYARAGSRPTTTSYTCKSDSPQNSEICTINSPAAGTYYILLQGYSAVSNVTLTGSY